ncbi:hypothetical protein TWF730_006101 [Orbilia blumenaviensis]|uniref:Uncharacterized protein n=1 Tax=Orbilia blumenaviensis TaxID=1796055 RepID=A0AAV9U0M1_9PEZI
MKTLAEIQNLELSLKEETRQNSGDTNCITINLRGKRNPLSDGSWAPAATTTIRVELEEFEDENTPELAKIMMLKIHAALNDIDVAALYNPQSTEVFFLYFNENHETMTMVDIKRLGEEGTVWYVVYHEVCHTPCRILRSVGLRGEYIYRRSPNSFHIFLEAWARTRKGMETVPVLLMDDLMDGIFLPTWKAVWESRGKTLGRDNGKRYSTVVSTVYVFGMDAW